MSNRDDEILLPFLDVESLHLFRNLIARYMQSMATDSLDCWLEFSSLTTQIDCLFEFDPSGRLSLSPIQLDLSLRAVKFHLQSSPSSLSPLTVRKDLLLSLPLDASGLFQLLSQLSIQGVSVQQ